MRGGRIALGILLAAAVACSGDEDEAPGEARPPREPRGRAVGTPTVSGPLTGGTYGFPFDAMPEGLAERYGYVEEEYILEGIATAYGPIGALASDGHWEVTESGTAPYETRVLVRRPADAADFDGTVVVEWQNVTLGYDNDSEFALAHETIMREGWAWVGVSAQIAGVESGHGLLPSGIPALRDWDPERYGRLTHPGDAYSYDIFSQAAQAVRRPGEIDLLAGATPQVVLATGSSQSAFRMATYVNAVHPIADIYDGFSIHKRGGGAAPLDSSPALALADPQFVQIRTDRDEPVLQFLTETDLSGGLRFLGARQDDSDTVMTWEVAGTAHADQNLFQYGVDSRRRWDPSATLPTDCGTINDGQQNHYFSGALLALRDWALDGTRPPTGTPLQVGADGVVATDEHGNALGGVRTAAVEAPNRTLTAVPGGPGQICALSGQTIPFDDATLAALYPTHEDYVAAVSAAVDRSVAAGFLHEVDGAAIVAEAESAPIP